MSIDQSVLRTDLAFAYREVVNVKLGYPIPAAASGDEIIALARSVDAGAYERSRGLRTDPPFPGAHAAPAPLPNKRWQLICACRVFEGDTPVGTIFTTFGSERPTAVFVNDPTNDVPKDYTPLR